MASTAITYPKISRKIWWLLRDRLKKSMPSIVTPTLITALSPMTDSSAKSNVLAPLRELGLVDEANKPTTLAEGWRHDDEYASVCHKIRAAVYPHELIEAFSEPSPEQREGIKTWFMKVGQVGEAAARMYTDTFMLLSEADTSKANEKAAAPATPKTARPAAKSKLKDRAPPPPSAPRTVQPQSNEGLPPAPEPTGSHRRLPAIHIDVQVHISPDTSPEQIDRIFESMAKHLGSFTK
ncbi:hypothetical protein GALL_07360 [mine drainage metagenome]|uniref:Uncharacterized protein n=1 Tax=mine drainage metagenome TaxID=410659 RepID=A0A1J5U1F3_9ZZZZ